AAAGAQPVAVPGVPGSAPGAEGVPHDGAIGRAGLGAQVSAAASVIASASASAPAPAPAPARAPAPTPTAAPASTSFRIAPRAYGDRPSVAELTTLGRALFMDASLSSSSRVACATCHQPAYGFGPGPAAASPFDDGDPAHRGTRAIPQLRYAQYAPRFTEHYIDDEDGLGVDAGPTGGLTWDGRRDTVHDQARIPLFAAEEMGNTDDASLAARVARAPYASAFRSAVSPPGGDVFADPTRVVAWMAYALEVYQEGAEFAPFSSQWDRVLAGRAQLTAAEQRGYALYVDAEKGNCDSCHPSRRKATGSAPLFTDAGFVVAAPPRRAGLPSPSASAAAASADTYAHAPSPFARDYDLGLCQSGRPGLTPDASFCGRFRAPSLRNVAVRPSFFHNGSLHSLRDVVAFYATRDTDPARWYGRNADGSPRPYDDLPPALRPFVDHEVPFEPRADGRPRLTDAEIDDIVAFLGTLTDADLVQ
ncbi:MAG TPA: cytochrome c peroxidase, partial [Burkholderiaceae bacterium]|nr:cytochrome c peroxidase [Burkholderiaceae bacterium]